MVEREVELKLAMTPAGIRALRRHPALRELRRTRPRTHRQRSDYFDTRERALARAGAALRIRCSSGRRVQTLKATTGMGGHERIEVSSPLTGPIPDTSLLPESFAVPGWKALHRRLQKDELVPLFSSEIRRTTWEVGDDDWSAEVCIDRGTLLSHSRSEPILEVELELKRGEPRRLFELGLLLLDSVPFHLLGASKAQRGTLLSAGREPPPRKWRAPRMAPNAGCGELLRQSGHAALDQFLQNQHCFEVTAAPGAVHQMRVAIRRLRAAVTVLRPVLDPAGVEAITPELRWLMAELGPLRDLDVFLGEIFAPVYAAFADDEGMEGLRAHLVGRRNVAAERLRETLTSRRLARLLLETALWLEGDPTIQGTPSAAEVASVVLEKRFRKLLARSRGFGKLSAKERHKLRLDVKKLRYAGEFFEPVHPGGRPARFHRRLARLQDALGKLNDVAVAGGLLDDAVRGTADPRRIRAAGLVLGWHAARQEILMTGAARPMKRVRRLKPYWA